MRNVRVYMSLNTSPMLSRKRWFKANEKNNGRKMKNLAGKSFFTAIKTFGLHKENYPAGTHSSEKPRS